MDDIQKLEAELEAIKARNAVHRAAAARRDRAAELRAAVLAETNAERDEPELAKLEGLRGVDHDIVVCRLGAVALRKPQPVQWKRFQESKQTARDAAETLVRSCLLYPDAAAFTGILDDQPAALEAFAMTCARLAGQDVERLTGKS